MMIKNAALLFKCWSLLALLAIAAAGAAFILERLIPVILPTAALIIFIWLYLAFQFMKDGPDFALAIEDERHWQNSSRAMRSVCWFFYVALWSLAIGLGSGLLQVRSEQVGMLLGGVFLAGLLIHMSTFLWFKYRV